MDLELKGRRALVTGGTRGIGSAITLALAAQGVEVIAVHRSDLSDERRASFADAGDITLVQADVAGEADAARIGQLCEQQFGGLDIVVNNAGVISHFPLPALEIDEWRWVMDTNLTGMFLITRAVYGLLDPGASVVNIGSAVATVGMAAGAHYTAAKAGVVGFSRSLMAELGPRDIRVNTVTPGIIDTDQAAGLNDEQRGKYAGLAALNRLGQAAEVADVVLFLASGLARFVSGVTINVDGGI